MGAVSGNSQRLLPKTELNGLCPDVVPVTGFEPVHPFRIWDFKSQVSASSTTPAWLNVNIPGPGCQGTWQEKALDIASVCGYNILIKYYIRC